MIEHIDYHVTDHCNLNCAGCDQFGTLANPWFISLEKVREDWQVIADKQLKIGRIHVLGGEPLLHPELDKILILLREMFPTIEIVVYTNGILMPQLKEKLLPIFKKYNIILFLSEYQRLNLNYAEIKKGFPRIEGYCVKDFMNISLHTDPDFNKDESFNRCNFNALWKCRLLKDNYIYPCSMIPNINHLIEYFPELKNTKLGQINIEDNGIDIRNHTAEEIEEFLKHSIPACEFCNVMRAKHFKPWYPSEYKITEWIEDGSINNSTLS